MRKGRTGNKLGDNNTVWKIILLSFLMAMTASCVVRSPENDSESALSEGERSLLWLESADAIADARKSVNAGDYRVYVLAGRGNGVPGTSETDSAQVRQRCGVRILSGTTDVVINQNHLRLLQLARQYAETYNRIVIERCGKAR